MTQERRTYGGWREPRTAGLYGLSKMATYALLAGLIIVVLTTMIGGPLWGLLIAAVVGAMAWALLRTDVHGRNLIVRAVARWSWYRARRHGAHLYRSGPLGQALWGTCQLPGIAAPLRLSEHEDGFGRVFAMVYCPATSTYAVTIASSPDGESLVDQTQIDIWVARWGQWLADISGEPALLGAAVTVETSPSDGSRLRARVRRQRDPNAPSFALRVLDEATQSVGVGNPEIMGYTTLVWSATDPATGARRKPEVMARDLATALPELTQSLSVTGAGACHLVGPRELCEIIRVAYDPAVASDLAAARAEGSPAELLWSDVGPMARDPRWDSMRHDSAHSLSYVVSGLPRGTVHEDVLRPVLEPHPHFWRKRVTLLFTTVDPAAAAAAAEADLRAAEFRVTAAKRPSARDQHSLTQAMQTAQEEAGGAALVDVGGIITVTVRDEAELDQAKVTMRAASKRSRLLIRPAYGAQGSTFAAGLPLGLMLQLHTRLSEELRGAA